MRQVHTTLQAVPRAARITFLLLQYALLDLDAWSTIQVAEFFDRPYLDIYRAMHVLAQYPELPIKTDNDMWWCQVEPFDLDPLPQAGSYVPAQRASVIVHRMVCAQLFLGLPGLTKHQLADLVGVTPSGAKQALQRMSCSDGAPVYYDDLDDRVWKICTDNIQVPYRKRSLETDCDNHYML
jgi:hypothetical protein